jgi:hypothetical protein
MWIINDDKTGMVDLDSVRRIIATESADETTFFIEFKYKGFAGADNRWSYTTKEDRNLVYDKMAKLLNATNPRNIVTL